MRKISLHSLLAVLAAFVTLHAVAADRSPALVSVAWLKERLGSGEVLLLDASGTKLYAAGHIPGAVSVDLYASGIHRLTGAPLEERLQGWGVSPGKKIVAYDQGGAIMATWLFWELYHHGFPAADLHVLDGGLAKWKELGGAVTTEPAKAAKGTFKLAAAREEVRVRLPEFLVGSGDPQRHAIVEALEPSYHWGETKFFTQAGHVPNSVMFPPEDFFNADKTFKSPEEIRRMAAYLGIRPDQQVYSHCGGGVAATVPYFALRHLAGFPNVKVYKESQLEWLRDDRGLPFWTYDAPYLRRDMEWVNGWNDRMMRMFGVSQISILDVRPPEAYGLNHIPYAINVPAGTLASSLRDPARLAAVLGPAGVDPAHEAVIVSSGGLTPEAALAFVALEKAGQKKVSIVMESMEDWGMRGFTLTKEATVVGKPTSPQAHAIAPVTYAAAPRAGVLVGSARDTQGVYPKVYVASGKSLPRVAVDGKVVHVPYHDLLDEKGLPKPAAHIWKTLVKAGVPRYAEIVLVADDPADAAVNYYLLRMMGFPDVKVLAG